MTPPVVFGLALALTLGWTAAVEATGFRTGGGVGAVRERIHSHSRVHRDFGSHRAFGTPHGFGSHSTFGLQHDFRSPGDFGLHRPHHSPPSGIGVGGSKFITPPCRDHGGRWTCVNPPTHFRSHDHVIVVPQPIFVAPSRDCLVPGHWAYQWVPQTAWQTVYVPGYWAADGSWVSSHYAHQPYTTGSYHQVWVPERWAC